MTREGLKPRDPHAKRGQCDYSKTGWSWQYADGACLCDPCPPPEGWKYDKKEGEWIAAPQKDESHE